MVVVPIDQLDQYSKNQEEVECAPWVVPALHDDEDDVVVGPIDQLDQCSRNQEEVGYAESVVTDLLFVDGDDDRCLVSVVELV